MPGVQGSTLSHGHITFKWIQSCSVLPLKPFVPEIMIGVRCFASTFYFLTSMYLVFVSGDSEYIWWTST